MHIGKNLKIIRKKFGWTQTDLANKTGLTKGQIQSYERDVAMTSPLFLMKLEEMTGIPIYDLLSREISLDEVPPSPLYPSQRDKKLSRTCDPQEDYNIKDLKKDMDRMRRDIDELKGRK